MEGPRAVAVAALELDNGPINLVKATLLDEVLAVDGDYTAIAITNAALPVAHLCASLTNSRA
jgi:hypothetical protein